MCEVFKKGYCLGCVALENEKLIDIVKKDCETYKKEMKRLEEGEQMKI